jgi:hypothetical protein
VTARTPSGRRLRAPVEGKERNADKEGNNDYEHDEYDGVDCGADVAAGGHGGGAAGASAGDGAGYGWGGGSESVGGLRLARMVFDAGLTSWLREKVS